MDGAANIAPPREDLCPVCSSPVKRFLMAQARYLSCGGCGTWFSTDKKNGLKKEDKKPVWKIHQSVSLPGAIIRIDDKEFVLVSIAEKADSYATEFRWREYTLFHPVHGYAWLSEYDGHWLKLRQISPPARTRSNSVVNYEGNEYAVFQKSRAIVKVAVGEFTEDIFKNSVSYEEYICPPYLLSFEGSKKHLTCFWGEHLEPETVAQIFGVDRSRMPERFGVGAAQPMKSRFSLRSMVSLFVLMSVLVIAIQLIFSTSSSDREVVNVYRTDQDSTPIVSNVFILSEQKNNLQFRYKSNVNNNWSELNIMLINEKTGEVRGLTMGVEYYSGIDDEGQWTEGETESEALLCNIDPGIYHLNIQKATGTSGSGGNLVVLDVIENVPVISNMFMTLLLLAIFPAWHRWRIRRFETNRWENSDYSPYQSFLNE